MNTKGDKMKHAGAMRNITGNMKNNKGNKRTLKGHKRKHEGRKTKIKGPKIIHVLESCHRKKHQFLD